MTTQNSAGSSLGDYKYYRNLLTKSIYRTHAIQFNDDTPGLSVQRWNWDFCNWTGHIHNPEKTRSDIATLTDAVELSKDEVDDLIINKI